LIVTLPSNVLFPETVKLPVPLFVRPPAPEITPESAPVPPLATITSVVFSNANVPERVAVPVVLAKSIVLAPAPVSEFTVIPREKLPELTRKVAADTPPTLDPMSMDPEIGRAHV
jgi:hypothetical protein